VTDAPPLGGCGDESAVGTLTSSPLQGVHSVAYAPGGGTIFALSQTALSFLSGGLTRISCVSNAGIDTSDGCNKDPLLGVAMGLAVGPDDSVYVAAGSHLLVYRYGASGLAQVACHSADDVPPCIDTGGTQALGALTQDVAVSPDGRSVYVLSQNTISHFRRAPSGDLTFAGCLSSDGTINCPTTTSAISGGSKLAVSPDSRSVYAITFNGLLHFDASPADGALSLASCATNGGEYGCSDVPPAGPAGPLEAGWITVSPDGASVFTSGSFSASVVAHFFRSTTSAAPAGTSLARGGTRASNDGTTTRLPRCDGRVATIIATRTRTNGTRRRDVIVGRSGRDIIDGRGGNDLICAGGGRDRLLGGPGRDRETQ
jgi:RTX calcium-binding nonapeptide repeat (4 copies)